MLKLLPSTRKIFLAFSIFGMINILLAYSFFYLSSTTLLEERSSEQMASVRTLASQKLALYLKNLKASLIQSSESTAGSRTVTDPTLKESIAGFAVVSSAEVSKHVPNQFYHHGDNHIGLNVPVRGGFLVWEISFTGPNRVLEEHSGLGKTGEIYLVGDDRQIKSASRHLRDMTGVKVDNESHRKGQAGETGVGKVRDYRGVEVISAYAPFSFDELRFVLLSEIDRDEVLSPLKALLNRILILCLFLCLVTVFLSYLFSSKVLELIEAMRGQITDLHKQLIHGIEDEKRRISLHLHDGVGQILTALKWGVSHNPDQAKLKELCDEAFREIRSVSADLMPAELSELGFFPAVRNYLRKQQDYLNLPIHFWNNENLEKLTFRDGLEVNLYRMIQEFLQNTIKHGQARSVSLVLFQEVDYLHLRYEDDGIGMPDAEPMPRVLQYRTELMGATLERSKTSTGLAFTVRIPLKELFQ